MLAWLQKHRQTVRAIRRFWEVILVSALDEELDRIDARYGIDVFWKAFSLHARRLSRRDSVRTAGRALRRLQGSHWSAGGKSCCVPACGDFK